jgi:uncharacterized repeat protein (TIGR01451 family)
MSSGRPFNAKASSGWIAILLSVLALWMLPASRAHAADCVADLGGLLDGFVTPVAPSQIQVDGNCRIQNFPASNPLSTNFSFLSQPGQTDERWLLIFNNVVHTGQMSCDAVQGHKIWLVNGSSTGIHQNCQNKLIPVEKIDKKNPAGQTTATIGVPFTYKLTIPILFDPATGNTIDFSGSPNDLHHLTIWDDLNATGVDLTYVSHVAYWKDSGAPVDHTFTNVGGQLTFDNILFVPKETQFIIEIRVVLDATPNNTNGKQFINTAKWQFGRLIDGVFYEPLPGEWGVSPPMTIAAPELVMTKTGPATMNLGQWGQFGLDVRNTGLFDAWQVTLLDRLPDGTTGGMCNVTPEVQSAQVFAADGVTPVPGKGPLIPGTDFSLSYSGTPACELTFNVLTAKGTIGPGERLIVTYRTQLDADTQNGLTLTNVAGAIRWFNGDTSNTGRQTYTRTLTNGTVGTLDHEDAHTVTVALSGYFFEKTVADLTSGANPALTAAPGDRLRYTLRIQTTDQPLSNARLRDEIDALNATAAFAPNTLALVTVPAGADASLTSSTGGSKGTGVVDIRNLSLPANSQTLIQFDVTLASVLTNGSFVLNQASLLHSDGTLFALSDDPNVNGQANPFVAGDEDPTRVQIASSAGFRVQKISNDLTGDPNLLLAGETLRYTITIKNIGTENAVGVTLRDQIPVNTTYVAGSTRLNGTPVADAAGTSSLVSGMLVNAPENLTPGVMRADASNTPGNVATITFDVRVDPTVIDGTVISNQGFVSSPTSNISDFPSDDPRTPIANDPTRDIVGSVPLIFPVKRVALQVDQSSPNIVDPGDVLRYTITVYNTGRLPMSGVVLHDVVPANTTYVADSVTLNGLPVGRPDNGVYPLIAGIDISSADLTPPLPGAGEGTLSPGNSAVVQFDLRVNNGVPAGTIISNQAVVRSKELPNQLTDGDGDPSTGPEPTIVIVGNAQQLSITKQVAVVGGGPALAGATLEYLVRVTNVSLVPALYVVITDDLATAGPGYLTLVNQSATMNGSTAGISVAGSLITADYSTQYGPLQPAQSVLLRFRAVVASNLALGTRITNTGVVTWNKPPQTANASVAIDVGGITGVGLLNGTAWHDANFNGVIDVNERLLEGWSVELYRNGTLAHSTLTAANGVYQISGIVPNYQTADRYELRFLAPGAGPNTAKLGRAQSAFTNDLQRISDIIVQAGSNLQNLDLPIEPNGVVYNTISRTPIAGAILRILQAGSRTPLPETCFYDPAQQGQVTLASGYYKFDINFSDPACSNGGSFLIDVAAPSVDYVAGYSQIIPPTSGPTTSAFSVPACPGSAADAIPGTNRCEAQVSEFAPSQAVRVRTPGTNYYVHLTLDDSFVPGSSQIFNNHIPLDPQLNAALAVTKTTPLLDVTRGQLVPYTITVRNVGELPLLQDVRVVDRFPAGFRYVAGSARIDDKPAEPTMTGRELVWNDLPMDRGEQHTIMMLLAVGAGVGEGEFTNRAQAFYGPTAAILSGEAAATVRVVPDPTFDCTDVTGKVFNDVNRNGFQDPGEQGLPGIRLVTPNGLSATTDAYGRYHITCAATPIEGRGSNFALKLDDRTLPSGYRASTQPLRVERATRGKALKMNFGASIYRVVSLDLADAVFEPGTTEIRLQWQPRMELLLTELRKAPSVLRLSYLAEVEDEQLVRRRLSTVKQQVLDAWKGMDGAYQLTIEPEVFWRLGSPPKQSAVRKTQ